MQNNMRTIHVGIFHLFQKNNKKHAGYKNPDTAASHHCRRRIRAGYSPNSFFKAVVVHKTGCAVCAIHA